MSLEVSYVYLPAQEAGKVATADDESAAHSAPAHRRCICDGAAYEVRDHPFIVNPDCPVHAG